MALRKRTNAYWQKRSTERVALLERQSEPYMSVLPVRVGSLWSGNTDIYGSVSLYGKARISATLVIDATRGTAYRGDLVLWNWNTTTALSAGTPAVRAMFHRDGSPINGIQINNGMLANGTKIRVWAE